MMAIREGSRWLPNKLHNFSLILEHSCPTEKGVLVDSDKIAPIQAARSAGYETNIPENRHRDDAPAEEVPRWRRRLCK